jgi:hypothetical protein
MVKHEIAGTTFIAVRVPIVNWTGCSRQYLPRISSAASYNIISVRAAVHPPDDGDLVCSCEPHFLSLLTVILRCIFTHIRQQNLQ